MIFHVELQGGFMHTYVQCMYIFHNCMKLVLADNATFGAKEIVLHFPTRGGASMYIHSFIYLHVSLSLCWWILSLRWEHWVQVENTHWIDNRKVSRTSIIFINTYVEFRATYPNTGLLLERGNKLENLEET